MKLLNRTYKPLPITEFVILFASLTSLTALSIDTMLPALPDIQASFGIAEADKKSLQLVISMLFLGMVFGEFVFGALSDAIGRKITILIGTGIFILGTIIAYQSSSFLMLIVGRLIQGFGVAAPKISSRALIRDQYSGEAMARIMSFIMMTFILVPMVAPAFGQLILLVAGWRTIFAMFLVLALITGLWFALRQGETLTVEKRIPLSVSNLYRSASAIVKHQRVMVYTATLGFIFGVLIVYLSTAQTIFQDLYHVGNKFVLYFAALAFAFGLASLLNGLLVVKVGIERLVKLALIVFIITAMLMLILCLLYNGVPPKWWFMAVCFVLFACNSFLFSNLNALALSYLGQIAGLGAAIVSAISTLFGVLLGVAVGWLYNETLYPLSIGFVVSGIASLLLTNYAKVLPRYDVVVNYQKS